jgi:hypothetical protein
MHMVCQRRNLHLRLRPGVRPGAHCGCVKPMYKGRSACWYIYGTAPRCARLRAVAQTLHGVTLYGRNLRALRHPAFWGTSKDHTTSTDHAMCVHKHRPYHRQAQAKAVPLAQTMPCGRASTDHAMRAYKQRPCHKQGSCRRRRFLCCGTTNPDETAGGVALKNNYPPSPHIIEEFHTHTQRRVISTHTACKVIGTHCATLAPMVCLLNGRL